MRIHQHARGFHRPYNKLNQVKGSEFAKDYVPTSVPCPECKAGVGERCISPTTGKPSKHASRKRMAAKAARGEL